jgi:Domain of unknown function (DUF4383)
MSVQQPRPDAPESSVRDDPRFDFDRSHTLQRITFVVGLVFFAVGILGFVPVITNHVGRMELAGHESPSELLGVFHVSVLHNVVHLLFGVVGVVASRSLRSARLYLLIGGAVYLLLLVYGVAVDMDEPANFVPVNEADNWLHFGLGVGMVLLGLVPTGWHAFTPTGSEAAMEPSSRSGSRPPSG